VQEKPFVMTNPDDGRNDMEKLDLDGQEIILLSEDEVQSVIETEWFEGTSALTASDYKNLETRLKPYPEVRFVLSRCPPVNARWWNIFHLYFEEGSSPLRISLQRRVCPECHWQGMVGTVNASDLYHCVPNKQQVLQKAKERANRPCPDCGTLFERGFAWTEPKESRERYDSVPSHIFVPGQGMIRIKDD
jgi:hypothetical protein